MSEKCFRKERIVLPGISEAQEILSGSISSVTFQNAENGYAILRLACDDGDTHTVVGTIPMPAVGERLIVTGHWVRHASYGPQFQAEFLDRLLPDSRHGIIAFLSTRIIKGVGERTAEKIVERFGEDSLRVIENSPERLTAIPGISLKRANEISKSFRSQLGLRRLIEYLSGYQMPAEYGVRLYKRYGERAVSELETNPYVLSDPEFGAPFSTVDAFALSVGCSEDDPRRLDAAVLYELIHNLGNGHVFLPEDKLLGATSSLLNLEGDGLKEACDRLDETSRMIRDTVAGLKVCYLPEYYQAECGITGRIMEMTGKTYPEPKGFARIMERIAKNHAVTYAEQQVEAIRAAATSQVMALTGGPGTGKTTTLAGMLEMFDALGLKTMLCAPTGRAAKRLSELTGREAATIHRLLEPQFQGENLGHVFFHDEREPLDTDVLVVDEMSMVDLLLFQSLLRALKPDCRLILVGDPDQLPSVGAGNVFSDLLRSGSIRTVRLTEVFRQAQESLIIMNAHAVNQGQLPELGIRDRDCFFLRRRDPGSVQATIRDLISQRLPDNMGIPASEIQVLSPTRKGETGTARLNQILQEALNPKGNGKRERTYGSILFREGDRVMQIRNNYDIIWMKPGEREAGTGVFNGDIGQIQEISPDMEMVSVLFDDGRLANYDFSQLSELEPAWAMTVHKSQGSEYRAVLLVAAPGSPFLLTRSVLYTAITRARELLIIVGDEQVIAAMVQNDRQTRRYSGLKLRLEKAFREKQGIVG